MKKIMLVIFLMLATFDAQASLEISPEVSRISYREKDLIINGEAIDVKEDGIFYGIHAILENRENVYLALDGRAAWGTVEYSGTGTIDEIEDTLYEVRGLIGVPLTHVVLYSGYGCRYLQDDAHGKVTDTGLLGYERESTYHYIPVGVKFDKWKFPVQAEIDILVEGKQESHFEKLGPFEPLVSNKQNQGVGFKVSIDFKKSFEKFDIFLTPFLRGWKVQDSKEDDGYMEPKNTSLEVGGSLGIKF